MSRFDDLISASLVALEIEKWKEFKQNELGHLDIDDDCSYEREYLVHRLVAKESFSTVGEEDLDAEPMEADSSEFMVASPTISSVSVGLSSESTPSPISMRSSSEGFVEDMSSVASPDAVSSDSTGILSPRSPLSLPDSADPPCPPIEAGSESSESLTGEPDRFDSTVLAVSESLECAPSGEVNSLPTSVESSSDSKEPESSTSVTDPESPFSGETPASSDSSSSDPSATDSEENVVKSPTESRHPSENRSSSPSSADDPAPAPSDSINLASSTADIITKSPDIAPVDFSMSAQMELILEDVSEAGSDYNPGPSSSPRKDMDSPQLNDSTASSKDKKQKRRMSSTQTIRLNEVFAKKRKPSQREMDDLAMELKVEVDRVQKWFIYKRCKSKNKSVLEEKAKSSTSKPSLKSSVLLKRSSNSTVSKPTPEKTVSEELATSEPEKKTMSPPSSVKAFDTILKSIMHLHNSPQSDPKPKSKGTILLDHLPRQRSVIRKRDKFTTKQMLALRDALRSKDKSSQKRIAELSKATGLSEVEMRRFVNMRSE
ncbi:hypothetical protein QR680_018962 [Steinernema hermaphroditum]|uniref:Homeobox domain-containing protein n=1 Tax=Steinernema hermaphroditum TaxID=289476 RepID=A0AA39HJJ3_9BILA|nr:hypothetical protein QR680_018962 [Steinernema hermaphroditum]